jgi:hypothetical protein
LMMELLSIFCPKRQSTVMDICCGTASFGLAALQLNYKFCILNDRDESCLKFAKPRTKEFIKQLRASKVLRCPGDPKPHNAEKWDGSEMYALLLEATKRPKLQDHIQTVCPTNAPCCEIDDEYVEDMGLVVQESGLVNAGMGLWLTHTRLKGSTLNMWGRWRRKLVCKNGRISCIKLHYASENTGSKRAIFLEVDPKCPAGFANDPNFERADDAAVLETNAVIEEHVHHSFYEACKVTLTFTKDVVASMENPVEVLLDYLLADLSETGAIIIPHMRTASWQTAESTKMQKPKGVRIKQARPQPIVDTDDEGEESDENDGDADDNSVSDDEDVAVVPVTTTNKRKNPPRNTRNVRPKHDTASKQSDFGSDIEMDEEEKN